VWVLAAVSSFGQGTILFSSGPAVTQPFQAPTIGIFGGGTIDFSGHGVSTPVPTTPPADVRSEFTIRVWDNSAGPIFSWTAPINVVQFSMPIPPPIIVGPIYGAPNFQTLFRLAGQSEGPTADPVPEPSSIVVGLVAGLTLLALRRRGRSRTDVPGEILPDRLEPGISRCLPSWPPEL
jgi:hypothetical protein